MHRLLLALVGLLVVSFASLVSAANVTAGEYYDGGYVSRGAVATSSNCCYRKVVRYVRKVSYVRVNPVYHDGYDAPRYRPTYYAPPRRTVYYGEPYRSAYYPDRPYRYDSGTYAVSRVSRGDGENCAVRRVRIADGYGGWVWVRTRVCY